MGRRNGRAAMAAVLALLGLLVVVQLRSQAQDPGLAQLSVQDLTELVANITTRNDQLRQEVATLEGQQQALAAAVERGDTSTTQMRTDLSHVLAWSGAIGVTGAGIQVVVSGELPVPAISRLVNELRNAGAEAIAVGGVRVVPGVVVVGDAGALTVGGAPVSGPLTLLAVGQPETLAGSLTRAGGPIAQLTSQFPAATVHVDVQDLVTVPATSRSLAPVDGRPRL